MATKTKVNLLRLTDAQHAFELLGDDAGLYGDNGGDPDGDEWLVATNELDPENVDRVVAAGLGEVVTGWQVEPYTEPNNYVDWCGYSSCNVAYFLGEDEAESCRLDEAGIEDTRGE